MSATLCPQSGAASHVGRVRQRNEDGYFVDEEAGLWAVADGMGGHQGGEWAAAQVVAALDAAPLPPDFDDRCTAVADRIHRANAVIHDDALRRGATVGTTVVALLVQDGRFALLWAGDSRAYVLRGGRLHQLSRDHTQVQEMVDRGLLDAAAAATHPLGHVLTRAVGVSSALEIDVVTDAVEPGDTFLLCSDGLHGTVGEAEIARALHGPPAPATARLVAETLARGAPDNVTAVAVHFREPTLLSLSRRVMAAS